MTTTQPNSAGVRHTGRTAPPTTALTVLVDTHDAAAETEAFLYAVIAALGMHPVTLTAAQTATQAANIQVSGDTIATAHQQWHYPRDRQAFEHWLVTTCFPAVETPTVWAVVQTSMDVYPLFAAALAYAYAPQGALLVDADPTGALSQAILEATHHAIEVLEHDQDFGSPHIYLLNAPRWHEVRLMLRGQQPHPLHSVRLVDTLRAARHHFAHTVIDCGADLFLAQRLAAEGAKILHIDDAARPLHVDLVPHKSIDYFADRIPPAAARIDFEYLTRSTRGRGALRRWVEQGTA